MITLAWLIIGGAATIVVLWIALLPLCLWGLARQLRKRTQRSVTTPTASLTPATVAASRSKRWEGGARQHWYGGGVTPH